MDIRISTFIEIGSWMTNTLRESAFASERLVKRLPSSIAVFRMRRSRTSGSRGRQKSCESSIISDRFDLTNAKSPRTIPVCIPINIQRTENPRVVECQNISVLVSKKAGSGWDDTNRDNSVTTYTNLVWGKLSNTLLDTFVVCRQIFSKATTYLALSILQPPYKTMRNQSNKSYHVGFRSILELIHFPGCSALKVLDIRLHDRDCVQVHQRTKLDATQRQRVHSLFIPSRHHRKRGAIGIQYNLRRALDYLLVRSGVAVAIRISQSMSRAQTIEPWEWVAMKITSALLVCK